MKQRKDRFRSLEHDRFDVIIVGAGTGGLTAGALLASRGKHVLVCDRHYEVGGNATVFHRRGYEFDVGVHYLGDCGPNGVIPRILRAAGIGDVSFVAMDQDAFDIFKFPDFDFAVSSNLDTYRSRLLSLFPEEIRGIDRYIKTLRQAWALAQIPQQRWLQSARTAWRSRTAVRYLMSTLGEFLDSCTKNPKLRAVWTGNQVIYTQPPSRAAAMVHLMGTMHYMQGPCYPKGGGQRISDRLASVIEDYGGKILLRTNVEQILVEKGKAVGVRLKNRHLGEHEVRAPVVISNADIKHTMLELLDSRSVKPRTRAKTREYEMSPALGVVYLGVRAETPIDEQPSCNYVVFPEYDVEPLYQTAREGGLYEKPWTCVTVASVKDREHPTLAPEGVLNVQLMTVAPSQTSAWGVTEEQFLSGDYRNTDGYLEAKERMTHLMLEQAEAVYPNLRDRIEYIESCTPLTHRRYTNSTGGTSYGLALTPSQFFVRRPAARTEIQNFYLCGASTQAGHGIPGVMLSGLEAASCVLAENLGQEVMGPANDLPLRTSWSASRLPS